MYQYESGGKMKRLLGRMASVIAASILITGCGSVANVQSNGSDGIQIALSDE